MQDRFLRYGTHYGYGWFVGEDRRGGRLVQHSGQGPTVSDYRLYLDENIVMMVLSNAQRPSAVLLSRALDEALFGEP